MTKVRKQRLAGLPTPKVYLIGENYSWEYALGESYSWEATWVFSLNFSQGTIYSKSWQWGLWASWHD